MTGKGNSLFASSDILPGAVSTLHKINKGLIVNNAGADDPILLVEADLAQVVGGAVEGLVVITVLRHEEDFDRPAIGIHFPDAEELFTAVTAEQSIGAVICGIPAVIHGVQVGIFEIISGKINTRDDSLHFGRAGRGEGGVQKTLFDLGSLLFVLCALFFSNVLLQGSGTGFRGYQGATE